jgi:hypothetical protein
MKRLAFISGSLFSSLLVIGSLFKIMHWPGAGPLLVFGLVGTAFISIPSIAKYQYDRNR